MSKIGLLVFLILAIVGVVAIARETHAIEPPSSERKKPEGNDVPFTTVDSGTMSGMSKKENFVVNDAGEWIALWKRHTSNTFPPPATPKIDFSSEMIIAMFAGEHSSGGWAIQIERIKDVDNKLVVLYTESSPEAGSINTMSLTQPYHIVRLAKSQSQVVFQRQ